MIIQEDYIFNTLKINPIKKLMNYIYILNQIKIIILILFIEIFSTINFAFPKWEVLIIFEENKLKS